MTCNDEMVGWKRYESIPGFQNVYLEDSFVMDVRREADSVTFDVEFVLQESDPEYTHPKYGEMYCYKSGNIKFNRIKKFFKFELTKNPFTDVSGEVDYGNIDSLMWIGNEYYIEGDWGKMKFISDIPEILY